MIPELRIHTDRFLFLQDPAAFALGNKMAGKAKRSAAERDENVNTDYT